MIKNIKSTKLKDYITEDHLKKFSMPYNHKMLNIIKCVEHMIQEYSGVMLSYTEIEFDSDKEHEFPYYPIISITDRQELDNTTRIKYECGLNKIDAYIAPILLLCKQIYHNEKLPTIEEIKKYAIWMPSKQLYI